VTTRQRERVEVVEERALHAHDMHIGHDQMDPGMENDIDAQMEQMIEDLYCPVDMTGGQSRDKHDSFDQESLGKQRFDGKLDVAAGEPLYSGTSFSVLRASLEILNFKPRMGGLTQV
jgi:hypothetical protein